VSWSGWESLGGGCFERVGAASWAADRLDIFTVGSHLVTWRKWWDGSAWSDGESLGGVCISAPAAVSWGRTDSTASWSASIGSYGSAGGTARPSPATASARRRGKEVSADHVQVDLQDGFADDVVEVWTEGRLAYRRTDVTTRHQIGLATSFELPVAHLPVELEVVVTSRGLRRAVRLDAGSPMHLGVSILDGRLAIRRQHEPFGYV
jgi:hypothetical protein